MGRTQRGKRAMVTVAAVLLAVLLGFYLQRRSHRKIPLRIATGQRGGTFLPLGQTLASALVDRAAALKDIRVVEARALSELAAERLEAGPAFRVLQEGLRTLEDDVR